MKAYMRLIPVMTLAVLGLFNISIQAMTDSECVVPAKPAGAMDITCKLAQQGVQKEVSDMHMRISYLPGGIGAVAWNLMVSQRRAEPNTLVAFSGGSLLNLAEGKFGTVKAGDVRWVAALGADYGMIAVRSDSAIRNLKDLITQLKRKPESVLIGVAGTIGSQDWVKMALLAKRADIDPKVLRFVALEGGGESFTAMAANHVQVVSGDASEAALHTSTGNIRVLAIFSEHRLPGVLSQVPTAREQGVDVVWPIIRGVWMGPQVSEADYTRWVGVFDRVLADPSFVQNRASHGLFPFAMTGKKLNEYVKNAVSNYSKQAQDLGVLR